MTPKEGCKLTLPTTKKDSIFVRDGRVPKPNVESKIILTVVRTIVQIVYQHA